MLYYKRDTIKVLITYSFIYLNILLPKGLVMVHWLFFTQCIPHSKTEKWCSNLKFKRGFKSLEDRFLYTLYFESTNIKNECVKIKP